MIKKWEYCTITYFDMNREYDKYDWDAFNKAGQEGWELVATEDAPRTKWGIFKREIISND